MAELRMSEIMLRQYKRIDDARPAKEFETGRTYH